MKKIEKKWYRVAAMVLAMMVVFQSVFLNSGCQWAKASEDYDKQADSKPTPTHAITSEDRIISSEVTLTEDLEVGNLTITSGKLDLNGHNLIVQGSIKHTGGLLYANKGMITCYGNYKMSGSASYSMSSQDSYFCIHGDFHYQGEKVSSYIDAGVLEIKGDFYQDTENTSVTSKNGRFYTSGTSTVIFSGTSKQTIHMNSQYSYFQKVILKNKSEEGIYTDTMIRAIHLERNSTKVTCGADGKVGYTLSGDEEYDGDFVLLGGTLDLNGYTLTVDGDFIQPIGVIDVNGGTLNVKGDYRLQNRMEEDIYDVSFAVLKMTKEEDRVNVIGDLTVNSCISNKNMLMAGTLSVGGNITQIITDNIYDNFAMSGNFNLVLNGSKKQVLKYYDSYVSTRNYICNLEILNPEGVELATEIYVDGHVNDHGYPMFGADLYPTKNTTFENHSIHANVVLNNSNSLEGVTNIDGNLSILTDYQLKNDLVVSGDLNCRRCLYFQEYTLEVQGNVFASHLYYLETGRLICDGDLTLSSNGRLVMNHESAHVLVKGDMYVNTGYVLDESYLSAGILEIQGNFTHTTPINKGNFKAAATHITKFTGNTKQTITFADSHSYFGTVELQNTSQDGVYAPGGIPCAKLHKNDTVYTTDLAGVSGWTLKEDEEYAGNLMLVEGELDLNGHTLTILGDLIQPAGTVNVNGGKLVVKGDYRLQSIEEQEGEEIAYGESTGYLYMTKEEDMVKVSGDFVTSSTGSHKNKLTNGVLKVAGNLAANGSNDTYNLYSSDAHRIVLNGSRKQTVHCTDTITMNLSVNHLDIENDSEDGVVITGYLPVSGHVRENGNRVTGTYWISSTTTFEEGKTSASIRASAMTSGLSNLSEIGGDLLPAGKLVLKEDLTVGGDLQITDDYLDVGGMTLTVKGEVTILGTNIYLNKGSLLCDGDLTLAYRQRKSSQLSMVNTEDYVRVQGNMSVSSYLGGATWMSAGTLELKGNFTQVCTYAVANFVMSGTSHVLLSGDSMQTISFATNESTFMRTSITNTSEEGVYSPTGIHTQTLQTNGNHYSTGYNGRQGWTLSQDEVVENDLTLNGGVLDLNGHTLMVRGNLIQNAGMVCIHGGTLVVEGNYHVALADGSCAWAYLEMTDENDKVVINGDFLMASQVDHKGELSAGILEVKGNVTQKCGMKQTNFATTGPFTMVMSGSQTQKISFDKATQNTSYVANLSLNNSSENGVIFDHVLVTGNVISNNGKTSGSLNIIGSTVFENNEFAGDLHIGDSVYYPKELHIKGNLSTSAAFTMGADLTVDGIFTSEHITNLNNHTLDVAGNVTIQAGYITVGKGKLLCGGDLVAKGNGLSMSGSEGYVLVSGNVEWETVNKSDMTAGTLEIKGDFTETKKREDKTVQQAVAAKTIFSGDKLQTITFLTDSGTFGTVVLNNTSKDGVYFKSDTIRALALERNGCKLRCDSDGTYGWSLTEDEVIEEDLSIIADVLDLNGHTLTVNGTLAIGSGSININGGKLIVNHDLRIQGVDGQGEYTTSSASLNMTNEKDVVVVKGDFVTDSLQNTTDQLTAGTMELYGDFRQKSSGNNDYNFVSSGKHSVKFLGDKRQNIYFQRITFNHFNHVSFENEAREIYFENYVEAVGVVEDHEKNVRMDNGHYLKLSSLSQLADGMFGGDVYLSQDCVLTGDVSIGGKLDASRDIILDHYRLSVGSLSLSSHLNIGSGQMFVTGDLFVSTYGSIAMEQEESYLYIQGDFTMASDRWKNIWSAGVLQVCGNISVTTYGGGFVLSGTHKTILSGKRNNFGMDYIQTITLSHPSAKFNELVLTKKPDKCYIFNKNVQEMCNSFTIENTDYEPPEPVEGLTVRNTTASTVSLDWDASTDNEGVEGYQIYRGTRLVGNTCENSFTDTGLEPETKYSYTVCAYDASDNCSSVSDAVIAMTLADESAPTEPKGMKVATQTGSSVTISWNSSRDDVKVTAYRVYRDGILQEQVKAAQKSYQDTGLEAGVSYTYYVTAMDGAGNESEASTSIVGTPIMPEITGITPENQAVIGGEKISLNLYYKNVGNSKGNKVQFTYSADGGETYEKIHSNKLGQMTQDSHTLYSSCVWNIGNLASGNYIVRAILYDADDNTDTCEVSYQLDTDGPAAPDYIEAVEDNGVVTISFSESDSANCKSYEIYRAAEGEDYVLLDTLQGRDNTTYVDQKVGQGEVYHYYVVGVDQYGQRGDKTKLVEVTVHADQTAPVVHEIIPLTDRITKNSVVTVKATDNIGIAKCILQYQDGEDWITVGSTTKENGSVVVKNNLPQDGSYWFRGVALDVNGNQGISTLEKIEVDVTGVAKPVINQVSSTSNSVRITWAQPTDADFDYYVVEQYIRGSYEEVAREGTTLGVYVRNLKKSTSYQFRVVGYDDLGNRGEACDSFTITTKEDTTEPVVKRFDPAMNYYQSTIPLSIQAADDCALGTMTISYSTDGKNWIKAVKLSASSNSTSYTYTHSLDISDLPEGGVYVHVDLSDASGNTYSRDVTRLFYKDLTAPDPLTEITATGKDGYIEVQWSAAKEEDFGSFDLYRFNDTINSFECISKATTALNYFDTNVDPDNTYRYRIVVNDLAGNSSEPSKTVKGKCVEDTTAPRVYGISPGNGKKVGLNETIQALVADNRQLSHITVDYKAIDGGDVWTEVYNESMRCVDQTLSFVWKNKDLEKGDYLFRITATDVCGNVSDEFTATYHFDPSYDEDTEGGGQESGSGIGTPDGSKPFTIVAATTAFQRAGKEYSFDATQCVSEISSIESYIWDFGDGTTGKGAAVTHVYESTGDYIVTLTVQDRKGNSQSQTTFVQVVSKTSGGVNLIVENESGERIPNAYVHISNADGKELVTTRTNETGQLEEALETGSYQVSAYSNGYLPADKTVKVTPGTNKKLTLRLKKDEVVVGTLSHRQLDVREMMELGIDLTNDDNWYTYTYQVTTYRNGEPTGETYQFHVSKGQVAHINSGGTGVAYTLASGTGGEHVLVEYRTVEWLKQMYEVELTLKNQAGEAYTVTDGMADLILPEGLSLAAMTGGKEQSVSVPLDDIPGQGERTICWYIKGDTPGNYSIKASFEGTLLPFHAKVSAVIYDKEPIVVTEENTNSNTDPSFLDPDKETRDYVISVYNYQSEALRGAYVELSYQGASTRGITDSEGQVVLQVNKDDDRMFTLNVTCDGYQNYNDSRYWITTIYQDYVVMLGNHKSVKDHYKDENTDYQGKFALDYITFDHTDISNTKLSINAYKRRTYQMEMTFSENATRVSVLQKDGQGEEITLVEKIMDSNHLELTIPSTDLQADMALYVRAKDKKTGSWHLYQLKNVEITYQRPAFHSDEYDEDTAVQCAEYAALAYKGEFSYDTSTQCISDKKDNGSNSKNATCLDLKQKLKADKFFVDDLYYRRNHGDDNRDNCTYTIASKPDPYDYTSSYVYVIVRGTDSVEWYGNMDVTGTSYDANRLDHKSFKTAEEGIYRLLQAYLSQYHIENAKIVVTGHSRGAAVSNLLAKDLIDHQTDLGLDSVCAYTFATPTVTLQKDVELDKYSSIYNFCFTDDFVPQLPLADWGYGKYGTTVIADSQVLSWKNEKYNQMRHLIRHEGGEIKYNSAGTTKMIQHVAKNWGNVEEYYNDLKLWSIPVFPKDHYKFKTLYEVMHDYVAAAVVADSFTIGGVAWQGLVMAEKIIAIHSPYRSLCSYFVLGDRDKSLFDTHHIDNYYAALRTEGFDTRMFSLNYNSRKKTAAINREKVVLNDSVMKQSPNIQQFRNYLNRKTTTYEEDGSQKEISYAELYGWDQEDANTWSGVTFDQEGNITAIDLPLFSVEGALDLSGFRKLQSLCCMYTDLVSIQLTGCEALEELVVPYNKLKILNLSDCDNLVTVDVTGNELFNIVVDSYDSIQVFRCEYNYLDVYHNENMKKLVKSVSGQVTYCDQNLIENAVYDESDLACLRKFLEQDGNAEVLGWDVNDHSTWEGVSWAYHGGANRIAALHIGETAVAGSLDLRKLSYLQELTCDNTNVTVLDIRGLKYLSQVSADCCQMEDLRMSGNDALRYLDCLHNYLDVDDIGDACREIAARDGAVVQYEDQYIAAGREAFHSEELNVLESFARNQEQISWDLDRPGSIPGITWTVVDGIYRVQAINLSSYRMRGNLDFSVFAYLQDFNVATTDLESVTLPDHLRSIPEGAFVSCYYLESITIPAQVNSLGKDAFNNCMNLKELIFAGNAPEQIGEDILESTDEDLTIYYYRGTTGWDASYWWQYRLSEINREEITPSVPPAETGLPSVTNQPAVTEEPTPSPSVTNQPTVTETPVVSPTVTDKPSVSKEPAVSPSITVIPTEQPVATGKPTPIPTETRKPTDQPGAIGTATSSPTITQAPSGKNSSVTGQKKMNVKSTKIKKVKRFKRKLSITFKRVHGVSGYVVYIRKGKKGKYRKIWVRSGKENRITIRKLKSGKKYTMKVRAYVKKNGKIYYSAYTKKKIVRTK